MGIINPIIEKMPQQSALEKENISSNEVNYSDEIENVIKDTKEALEEGNFQIISQYSKQIEDLNKKLQIE